MNLRPTFELQLNKKITCVMAERGRGHGVETTNGQSLRGEKNKMCPVLTAP
jgi:hypothetical protein